MSDFTSYRKEKLKFYLKAVDVLRDRPLGSETPLDDLYSDAVSEAEMMWYHFNKSILNAETTEQMIRLEEEEYTNPEDYDLYKAYFKKTPK